MRIACPTCDAAYDVPAPIVAARRIVRCARCAAEFTAAQDEPALAALRPVAAAVDVQEPAAAPALQAQATDRLVRPDEPVTVAPSIRRPAVAAVLAAWVLSLAVLAAGSWAVLVWRQPIMRAWPASDRLYAALGYGVR